jgi:hypothetical protein
MLKQTNRHKTDLTSRCKLDDSFRLPVAIKASLRKSKIKMLCRVSNHRLRITQMLIYQHFAAFKGTHNSLRIFRKNSRISQYNGPRKSVNTKCGIATRSDHNTPETRKISPEIQIRTEPQPATTPPREPPPRQATHCDGQDKSQFSGRMPGEFINNPVIHRPLDKTY